ncbi:hypothetical protein G9A89_009215 [Geosiphon pyriformis]|nr:hypothetical protein G9A89_009215 [Geosiphon pyriformis]
MLPAAAQLQRNILSFWFKGFNNGYPFPQSLLKTWFMGGDAVNNFCRENYSSVLEEILQNRNYMQELGHNPEGALSLIILLDKFSRHIYRKKPDPFRDFDPLALETAFKVVNLKWDEKLSPVERTFFYMPFEHSENLNHQLLSVVKTKLNMESSPQIYYGLLKNCHEFALEHKKIIERFGRFPHRNLCLDRQSTPEEIEYLKNGANRYGQ